MAEETIHTEKEAIRQIEEEICNLQEAINNRETFKAELRSKKIVRMVREYNKKYRMGTYHPIKPVK